MEQKTGGEANVCEQLLCKGEKSLFFFIVPQVQAFADLRTKTD